MEASFRCPPDATAKEGFYPLEVYMNCLNEFPSINDLLIKKSKVYGDKTWLISTNGSKYSYAETARIVSKLGTGLKSIGIERGDKVAIFAYNSPEWIFSYFGILYIGAVPVTVNTGFLGDPLIYNFQKSDTKYAFLDYRLSDTFSKVADRLNELKKVVVIGNPINDVKKPAINYESLINHSQNIMPPEVLKWDDPSAMMLTSGTTGPSKVVVESNAQFIATALDMIDAGGVNEDSKVYVYLPLFHIMALDLATISSMLAGATMVLTEKFNPQVFWKHINEYGITHFHAVGPILEMLLKQPESDIERNHKSIIAIAYSSSEVWNEAIRRFNIKITGGYGGTEAGIPVTSPYSIVYNQKNPPGSCGKAAPPFEIALENEQGNIVKKGQGEILIRPKLPYVTFLEYYKMPDATVKAFRGLWFHTGDLGRIDDDGNLYFVDRLKDSIRRKGENISSFEIEQILLTNNLIRDVAVVPVKSGYSDEEVLAVIVPASENLTPEEVINFSINRMPSFWIPSYIRFVTSLPKTPTGRTEKFKLKEEGLTKDTVNMKDYIKDRLRIKQ